MKFISYFTRRPTDSMRPPTGAEAEEADRAALAEVFNLCFDGRRAQPCHCRSEICCDTCCSRSPSAEAAQHPKEAQGGERSPRSASVATGAGQPAW